MASTNFLVDAKMGVFKPEFCNGVRVNPTGRRTFTAEYKREVISECRRKGTSVSAVALRRGLNANVVRKWLRQSGARTKPTAPPTLLPVSITTVPVVANERRNAAATDALRGGTIDIEFAGARVSLHGAVDADTLRCVLMLLRQA